MRIESAWPPHNPSTRCPPGLYSGCMNIPSFLSHTCTGVSSPWEFRELPQPSVLARATPLHNILSHREGGEWALDHPSTLPMPG